jgi:hypothetical protein
MAYTFASLYEDGIKQPLWITLNPFSPCIIPIWIIRECVRVLRGKPNYLENVDSDER